MFCNIMKSALTNKSKQTMFYYLTKHIATCLVKFKVFKPVIHHY